jgi:hypothetical protein
MNIARTHTLQFWRYAENIGPYGTVQRTWTRMGGQIHGDVQHRAITTSDPGPGTHSQGQWKVYTDPVAAEPQMVVQVIQGPNAPVRLEINDAYNVRGRLTQMTCSRWEGTLDG